MPAALAVIASYWLRWSVRFIGPDEWDFLCFYLNGRVAAHGLNFYDRGVFAEVFRQISIPYAPSRGFVNGYLNVTFPYPPPTIFLFMPLGYLDYASANILWLGFVLLTFVLCVYVAYRVSSSIRRRSIITAFSWSSHSSCSTRDTARPAGASCWSRCSSPQCSS